jgi:hypothetical protein
VEVAGAHTILIEGMQQIDSLICDEQPDWPAIQGAHLGLSDNGSALT